MLSKRYESTEVDRRTWLHVQSVQSNPRGFSLLHTIINKILLVNMCLFYELY